MAGARGFPFFLYRVGAASPSGGTRSLLAFWIGGANAAPVVVPSRTGNWDTSDPLFYDWWRRKHRRPVEEIATAPEVQQALAQVKPLPKRELSKQTIAALADIGSLDELKAFDAKAFEREAIAALVAEFERLQELDDEDVMLLTLLH